VRYCDILLAESDDFDIDAYHGSDSPSIAQFDDAMLHGWQYGARGHSFAFKPNAARGYGKYLYHVKLRVQNPKVVHNTEDFASLRADFLRAEGYDAAIGPNDLGQWEIRVLDPKNVHVVGRTVNETVDRGAAPATMMLDAGTSLFHGTAERFDARRIRAPAWFAETPDMAEWIASVKEGSDDARVLEYVTKSDYKLVVLTQADLARHGIYPSDGSAIVALAAQYGADGAAFMTPHSWAHEFVLGDVSRLRHSVRR
jgi:hypothetical protein